MDDRTRLLQLLLNNSFKLGKFTLSSGKKSDYYIDVRTTSLHPEGSYLISRLINPILYKWGIKQVGGLTLGADPIVASISTSTFTQPSVDVIVSQESTWPIPAFIVRKKEKDHGGGNLIEGCFDPKKKTAIIEDVLTTGESALKAVKAAREAKAEVVGVVAVVDREEGGREALEAEGLRLEALFTATELKAAARAGRP